MGPVLIRMYIYTYLYTCTFCALVRYSYCYLYRIYSCLNLRNTSRAMDVIEHHRDGSLDDTTKSLIRNFFLEERDKSNLTNGAIISPVIISNPDARENIKRMTFRLYGAVQKCNNYTSTSTRTRARIILLQYKYTILQYYTA